MDAARWRRIDEIFHSAEKLDAAERPGFLAEACGKDEELRRELEHLLARDQEAGSFLESPAFEVAAEALAQTGSLSGKVGGQSADLSGSTFSHYRVLSKLGSGGMGVVYEGEDIRLGRRVALKFLSGTLARDPEALQRFVREARTASSLNHSNICTIFEVEEHDGEPVIVMELLEGISLRERMAGGPVKRDELVDIGTQISGALEAAHSRGIVHRDIKPANLFVMSDGRVKVLDFGLAKVVEGDPGARESLTVNGAIAGTTSYMSPEQARGEPLDTRSDLFSIGIVLYEMATGQHPFLRKNSTTTIDAILHDRPPTVSSLNAAMGGEMDKIVARALEKDRTLRYQRAVEIGADLKRIDVNPAVIQAPGHKAELRWVAASALMLATAGGAFFHLHRSPKLSDKDTIVLSEFENRTGDPVFDGIVRQGLTVQLGQSPFLSLLSEERIQGSLKLMGRPKDSPLTPDLAREICERVGAAAVLDGSITKLGNQYVLGLRARSCRNGSVLDEEQVQAGGKEEVLNALTQIASKFRIKVGESLATVEKHATPLAEATTPSLEALKAYSEGAMKYFATGPDAAMPHFKRAVEIDSKFAMAHAYMGRVYGDREEPGLSRESTRLAYELRDRASDREKFFIISSYDLQVSGNLEKAQPTYEQWIENYPRDVDPIRFLGLIRMVFGRFDAELVGMKKLVDLHPDFAIGYSFLAKNYQIVDKLGEAESILKLAAGRKLEIPEYVTERYNLAFLRGDSGEMGRQAALASGNSFLESEMLLRESSTAAYAGRLGLARSLWERAAGEALQTGAREKSGLYQAAAAVREAFFGNVAEAKRRSRAATALSREMYVEYGAGLALALAGDSVGAKALADDLEQRFGEDTGARYSYIPGIRAQLAINNGDPAKALEVLRGAVPCELGIPRSVIHGTFGALYPIYLRGQAYLAAHKGKEAAEEFQRILAHPGLVGNDPIGALARLQLGRALEMARDVDKARAAYRDVLEIWKTGDAGEPLLVAAKAEYSKLAR